MGEGFTALLWLALVEARGFGDPELFVVQGYDLVAVLLAALVLVLPLAFSVSEIRCPVQQA